VERQRPRTYGGRTTFTLSLYRPPGGSASQSVSVTINASTSKGGGGGGALRVDLLAFLLGLVVLRAVAGAAARVLLGCIGERPRHHGLRRSGIRLAATWDRGQAYFAKDDFTMPASNSVTRCRSRPRTSRPGPHGGKTAKSSARFASRGSLSIRRRRGAR